MNMLARHSVLVLTLFVSGFAISFPPVKAAESPEDTNQIESLTPEQARKLAKEFPGVDVMLEITGIGELTMQNCLPLNGLKSLDASTAKALAGYRKEGLRLNGLTMLDADTAKALAGYKGRWLHLNGLSSLDAATAKAIAELKGQGLVLCGLTTLDPETAKALTEFKGQGLVLGGLTTLDTPDSVAVAQALATRKGPLELPNLKKISPKTLTTLIEKRDVEIPPIETLELIPEPDGSPTKDFVIPEWWKKRQMQQRFKGPAAE